MPLNMEKLSWFLTTSFTFTDRKALYTLQEEKRNHHSYSAMNPVNYNSDLPARYTHSCNSGTNIFRITNHLLIGNKACSLRLNLYLTVNEAKNLRLDR